MVRRVYGPLRPDALVSLGDALLSNAKTHVRCDMRFSIPEKDDILKDKDFELTLKDVLDADCQMLLARRNQHGNAIMEPINVFHKGSRDEKIKAMLDMKLERIRDARTEASLEDSVRDLRGYLILLEVSKRLQDQAGSPSTVGPALYRVGGDKD